MSFDAHGRRQAENERIHEVMTKSNIDPKVLPLPLPVHFLTFEKLAHATSGKDGSQKKGLGFGIGPRLPLSEKEKWQAKVQRYNSTRDIAIDPNTDPMPAPNAYSLIAHWPGKKTKKTAKDGAEKLPNILTKVSKGPVFSPYYVKIK